MLMFVTFRSRRPKRSSEMVYAFDLEENRKIKFFTALGVVMVINRFSLLIGNDVFILSDNRKINKR